MMKNDKWWQIDKMGAIMRGGKYSDTWSNSEMALDRVTKSGGIQMDGNDARKWFQSKSKIFEFSNSESHRAEWQSHLPDKINIWGDQNDYQVPRIENVASAWNVENTVPEPAHIM